MKTFVLPFGIEAEIKHDYDYGMVVWVFRVFWLLALHAIVGFWLLIMIATKYALLEIKLSTGWMVLLIVGLALEATLILFVTLASAITFRVNVKREGDEFKALVDGVGSKGAEKKTD